MRRFRENFRRVDIQVMIILCGFHTVWVLLGWAGGSSLGMENWYKVVLIVIWAALCLFSIGISAGLFQRISNPGKKELWSMDLLTGLKNRNAFEVDLCNFEKSKKGKRAGIVVIDLDHLKKVNDAKGHGTGDAYIHDAAMSIHAHLCPKAIAYRIGGDEFAILVPDGEKEVLKQMICDIQQHFQKEYAQNLGKELFLSAGSAVWDGERNKTLADTLKMADKNMYEEKNKREGKNRQKE